MIQLYFLSILFNGLSGYTLVAQDGWDDTVAGSMNFSPRNETFRLVLGILTAVTGLLKLLSPAFGTLPFLGDLIPSLAGLTSGFMLTFGYYRDRVDAPDGGSKLDRFAGTLLGWKKGIGFFLIVSALLHFLFPRAFLL